MEQASAPKRPTFLTVLCILTFIGVGISVVMQLLAYTAMEATSSFVDTTTDFAKDLGTMADSLNTSSDSNVSDAMSELDKAVADAGAIWKHAKLLMLIGVGGALLCLVGAVMMWKLKKTGFYIYTLGQLTPIIVSLVLIGGATFAGGALAMIGPVIALAFIVMYGLNLKHMS